MDWESCKPSIVEVRTCPYNCQRADFFLSITLTSSILVVIKLLSLPLHPSVSVYCPDIYNLQLTLSLSSCFLLSDTFFLSIINSAPYLVYRAWKELIWVLSLFKARRATSQGSAKQFPLLVEKIHL